MMTREDMLRELELLPIWSLRKPLPSPLAQTIQVNTQEDTPPQAVTMQAPVEVVNEVLLESTGSKDVLFKDVAAVMPTPVVGAQALVSPAFAPQTFRHVVSEDGDWLFVLSNPLPTEDEALLLRNIFMVMGIRAKLPAVPAITVELLQTTQPKLVMVMGEAVAQQLLQSAESLANLRGTVHVMEGIALVVTYELAHLLQVRLDKEKAWADLCLAMQTLQRLKFIS